MSRLYKVTINWHGEVLVFWTQAKSVENSLNNAIRRLAKKLGVSKRVVDMHVREDRSNRWKVEQYKDV